MRARSHVQILLTLSLWLNRNIHDAHYSEMKGGRKIIVVSRAARNDRLLFQIQITVTVTVTTQVYTLQGFPSTTQQPPGALLNVRDMFDGRWNPCSWHYCDDKEYDDAVYRDPYHKSKNDQKQWQTKSLAQPTHRG